MQTLSYFLAGGNLICGLIAAWYWFRSSQIRTRPSCLDQSWDKSLDDVFLAEGNWMSEFLAAIASAAELNSKAAVWTAASVVLGTAGSIFR